ncbi:uncharacterized protein LOC105828169 isoform X2 [Monomorium pharaonis]|uniref:uncharacterized protein LOC105828169 isoform X2 n=1 Tax=Monomorium pharaonis TaxID=307658 RepID=UPI00102E185C|nr:uncharacterized protein LOC105828169 isoform X2 [Monomorium pharaonis]
MFASTKSKEVADEYISSLSDLTINSKPLINMLTMLAEDNIEHAPAIVQAVENHLLKVRSEIKLPVLYLIDSIVKNVCGNYLNLFTQNIVNTFCGVFEKVDENTRASMWKLRQTWNDVFPPKKLFSLDVRVQSIDPAWPITAPSASIPSGSIHVNPRFLSMPQQTATSIVPPVKLPPGEPVTTSEAAMREQLLKKQRELLELQKKKIELELLQAKASLEQQQRQLDKQAGSLKTEVAVSTTHVTPTTETTTQAKPVAPVVPNQTPKQVAKQFPAAAATLLKNAGATSGTRIAPASSIAVASAKPVSRDPRLKPTPAVQDVAVPTIDPRQRPGTTSPKEARNEGQAQQVANTIVTSNQLKQQILLKSAVTIKPPANLAGSDNPTLLNVINNNNADNNSNNKNFSSNVNKDAVSHRTSQKKDPRLNSNSSGNLNSNNSKNSQSLSVCSNNSSSVLSGNNRGSGGSDINKSKDSKSSNSRGSSSSLADKSSTSSKSSHRKLGNKSRSKQPQTPNKIPKTDRDSSPIRSKSREKDSGDSSSPSSRTSPQSSFQASKNRKKNTKSRKRSPSPPYRIPRRNDAKSSSSLSNSGGVTEEEQSGSLIVSPPHPPAFKEIRPNARQRNYVRRNKDDSLSPERSPVNTGNTQIAAEPTLESSSKDEDLRTAPLSLPGAAVSISEKKEDLDLRVLPSVNTNKRRSEECIETNPPAKKTKAEKFDALFGNEDVDLRTLTHPNAGRPPTPPPPVISGEDGKDGWAKLKTPTKNDRDKQVNNTDDKRDRDRRDRLGRLRLYNKLPDDPKERRRTLSNEEQDSRPGRRGRENDKPERNDDRNIEIIMKQAAEQLNQGSITKTQYNTLIQEVLHMSEDRKLRAAQRKEKEAGTVIWEKSINMDMTGPGDRGANFNPSNDKEMMRKEHPIPRNPNGPRWQNQPWQQPWAHPPGPPFGGPQGHFNSDMRPVGPWQNPRHFGPMRPDYQYHSGFNHGMGPNPRLGPGMMGPMGPNGPIMSNLLSNGPPMGPMGPMGPNSPMTMGCHPAMMMNNGPMPNLMSNMPSLASNRNVSPNTSSKYDLEDNDQGYGNAMLKNPHSRELPPPDSKLLAEIARDTMKSINIDNIPREIRYYGQIGVVFMNWDDPREIGFQDGIRRILIDEKDTITCAFNDQYKEFMYEGEVHRIKLGAPTRELYVDDRWYECYFGGMPITIELGGKKVSVKLEGPPPQVKIGTVKRTDLVVAKINLIINARNMVPVFLDAKPQIFEIEGKPHTLEFTDALQTVLLNGRPFKVEFGGLPKPIIVRDKKHFIRFSVLPRGVRAGHVKITGMRGEGPIESPPPPAAPLIAQKPKIDTTPAKQSPSQLPAAEHESTSQDGLDFASTSKPDLQLDMLSSVLPSAMAPSSGLSYQAEPVENSPVPAPTLPLNMSELFQRLVETGIVPNLTEQKKQEEEEKKEPEITPVSFDKPETLKIKQPAIATALYSGMQCSSCGARFAPELATRYSHHLDWHFRQNRRERDSARKAHSRPWYYDVSDWIQFEEIEDLEDRAQSWFETEKQSAEMEGMTTDESPQETLQPSVPTGNDEDSRCQVCHDAFEQFYNEEKEEWHLRPAVNYEGKNYHPLCLDDYKRALEKSALAVEEAATEGEENKVETPGDEIKQEESKDISNKEKPEVTDNQVDQVEVNMMKLLDSIASDKKEEPIENSETENSEVPQEDAEKKENTESVNEENTKGVEDAEKDAPTINKEEESPGESAIVPFDNIKIKEEPLDDIDEQPDSEMFDFTNVEVKEEPMEPEPDPEQIVNESSTVDTTYAAVKSSIDGNVELDSTPAAIPPAPSRIKINITKPLNVNKESEENKEKEKVATETPVEENAEQPLVAASIKPSLQGRKLSNLPPVEKGQELSGLCSIM